MKIFVVINNYGGCQEADNVFGGGDPVWFELPDSSVCHEGNPFFVPDFADDFRAFPSVAYRIGRLGKSIAPKFAQRYIDGAAFAFSVVAVDLLEKLRAGALPWNPAVAFDRSCLIGNFQPYPSLINNGSLNLACAEFQSDYSADAAILPIEDIIALLSRQNTLKTGDIILSALSPAGIPLRPGTRLSASVPGMSGNLFSDTTNAIDIKIR